MQQLSEAWIQTISIVETCLRPKMDVITTLTNLSSLI